jgi:hypothetical protein
MQNINPNCEMAKGLYDVERDARQKANRTSDSRLQLSYGLVAIALQLHRFRHEERCPCCARQMKVAA